MEMIKAFNIEFDPDNQELFYSGKKYKYDKIVITEDLVQFTTIDKDLFNLTSELIETKKRALKKYNIEYTYEIKKIQNGSIFSSLNDYDIALVEEKKTDIHYMSTGTAYKKQYLDNGKHYSLFETVEEFNEYLASDFNSTDDWSYYKLKTIIDKFNFVNKEKLYNMIPYVDTYSKYTFLLNSLNNHNPTKNTTDDLLDDLMDTYTNESKKKLNKVKSFLDSLFN